MKKISLCCWPIRGSIKKIFQSLRSQNYNFSPCFSILCSNSIIIFCSRWYWWCYYFLKGTHPQLCKFLPQSLKASFKVCRLQKVHVPHSQQQIFFLSKPLFVPKKFFFPKVIAKHLFPWKLPHKHALSKWVNETFIYVFVSFEYRLMKKKSHVTI